MVLLLLIYPRMEHLIPVSTFITVVPLGKSKPFLAILENQGLKKPEAFLRFDIRKFCAILRFISSDHQISILIIDNFSSALSSY
jgi:hypothetical protein